MFTKDSDKNTLSFSMLTNAVFYYRVIGEITLSFGH